MARSEIDHLIFRYLDGTATADEIAELDAMLVSDDDVAGRFVEIAEMSGMLRDYCREEQSLAATKAELAPERPAGASSRKASEVEADDSLLKAARRSSRRASVRRMAPKPSYAWLIPPAAAALVLLASVFYVARKPSTRRPSTGDTPPPVAQAPAGLPGTPEVSPRPKESPAADDAPEGREAVVAEAGDDSPALAVDPDHESAGEVVRVDTATDAPDTAAMAARIKSTTGMVMVRRGGRGKWFKASPGLPIESGDEIDTRAAMAEVAFLGGSRAVLNRASWVEVGLDRIRIRRRGEVYVEVSPAAKGRFVVATDHASVTDIGTRFGVDVSPRGTVVTVTEGSVECRNDHGRVVVTRDHQSRTASAASAPGEPRPVDSAKLLAWAGEIGDDTRIAAKPAGGPDATAGEIRSFRTAPPEGYRLPAGAILTADFESGNVAIWRGAKAVPGGFEPGRFALQLPQDGSLVEFKAVGYTPTERTVVQFAVLFGEPLDDFQVQTWDRETSDNARSIVKGIEPGRWHVVKVRFRDFFYWHRQGNPVGHRVRGIKFWPKGKAWIDDVVIYEEEQE